MQFYTWWRYDTQLQLRLPRWSDGLKIWLAAPESWRSTKFILVRPDSLWNSKRWVCETIVSYLWLQIHVSSSFKQNLCHFRAVGIRLLWLGLFRYTTLCSPHQSWKTTLCFKIRQVCVSNCKKHSEISCQKIIFIPVYSSCWHQPGWDWWGPKVTSPPHDVPVHWPRWEQ